MHVYSRVKLPALQYASSGHADMQAGERHVCRGGGSFHTLFTCTLRCGNTSSNLVFPEHERPGHDVVIGFELFVGVVFFFLIISMKGC